MAPADLIGAALAAVSGRQLTRALQVLTRTSEGRDAFARTAREALDRHLPELVERADDDGELPEALSLAVTLIQPGTGAIAAMDSLPATTGPQAGLATQVLLIATVALEKTAADGADELLEERARAHGRLAMLFTEQGQRRWAVAASRRAVGIRRLLAERGAEDAAEGLATALNNLSVILDEPGQAEESLKASEEAVAMFRRLAEADPEAYLPSLATALANLSVNLAAAGHDDEALAAVQEAASALAGAGADEKRAERAWVLHNLSVRLAARGRHAEAVEAIGEAVRIRRELASSGPDRFRADLASSLNGYSVRLGAVGRQAEALAAIEEAVRIRRELAVTDPGRYRPALATSLNNLSVDLNRAGRPVGDALAASAEAVRIRRDLARAEPGRFRPDLAAALHNMSADLAASGQVSQALDAIQEAVAVRRELAASRPHLHARDLASSLRILSIRLAAAGRPAEAADAAEESAGIFRSLAERQPGRFRPDLATSLSTLSSRLGAAGRHQEALAAAEECVELRRALAAAAPDAYLPELAVSLNNLSVGLSRAGQPQRALTAAEETVRIRRDLAAAHPGLYTADLATSLNTLGVDLGDAGRHLESLAALREAVRLLRPLAASDPPAALPDLVMSLSNLCEQLAALGRRAEAEQLFARLLAEYSGGSWPEGIILLGRGQRSAEDGNVTAAITDARDALELLQADAPAQARARRFLRRLRRQDPGRFDLAWDDARGGRPAWLRHLDGDRLLASQVDRWVTAPTMEEEEALLAANPRLTSEEAEAILDHLIDDNSGNRWLHMHRNILRSARTGSVEDAYAQHRKLLWQEGVAKALVIWFGAAREDLWDVLAEEKVLLLSEEATSQAESTLATTARTPDLIWRAGLLALCHSDGEEAAFQVSADPGALGRPPGPRALTAFEPRDLALARLRAGLGPDDPEAAFVHAVLALAAGLAAEADEAIGRCAEESTSWDRRAAAVHLTELTAIRPDLAAGLARLRSILAASESDKHSC